MKTTIKKRRDFTHLAGRLFGTPLLFDPRKLESIIPIFQKKLNGEDADNPEGEYNSGSAGEPIVTQSNGVAVISIIGSLVRRGSWIDAYSGLISYHEILEMMACAMNDARVRGIMLQVDSFGGEAAGCFELCDELVKFRGRGKPIFASADVNALSAGYAIASCSDKLFVAPSGALGSIGVVAVHMERSIQNEMMGLTYNVFAAGNRKADGNPYEKLAPEAARKLQISLEKTQETFARMVENNRPGLTFQQILDMEGQWYDADEALTLGLADEVATYEQAFLALAASIAPAPAAQPPREPPAPIEPSEDDQPNPSTEGTQSMTTTPTVAGAAVEPTATVAGAAAGATAALPASPALPDNVVALTTEARNAGAAAVTEIVELCEVAGKPELAAGFIRAGKTGAQVRTELLNAKASAAAAGEAAAGGTINNTQPEKKADPSNPLAGLGGGGAPKSESLSSWDAALSAVNSGRKAFRLPDENAVR
jgi:signal peptide peptidase SppA